MDSGSSSDERSRLPVPSSHSKLPAPKSRLKLQALRNVSLNKVNTSLQSTSFGVGVENVATYQEDMTSPSTKRKGTVQFEVAPPKRACTRIETTHQLKSKKNDINKKRSRRSVSNALKIERNKMKRANEASTSLKPALSRMPAPVARKPLYNAPTRKPVSKVPPTKVAPIKRNTALSSAEKKPVKKVTSASKTKRKPWDLRGQLDDLQVELEREKNEKILISDIQSRLEALESEKNTISTQKVMLSSDLTSIQQQLDSKTMELERSKRDFEAKDRSYRMEVEDLTSRLRKVEKNRDELDLEVRELRRNVISLTDKNADFMEKIKLLDEQNLNLTKNLSEMTKSRDSIESELKEKEAERKKLLNDVQELKGNIRVFCRVRPMSKKEVCEFGEMYHIDFEGSQIGKSINITSDQNKPNSFSFDRVFDEKSQQIEVFEEVSQLVQSALDGYNVCVFAYGQTGAGKTYTMEGPGGSDSVQDGIIPRAMDLIFQQWVERKKYGWEYTFEVQHVEIYRETLQDLLHSGNEGEKLDIKTVGTDKHKKVWVKNLSVHPVNNTQQVYRLLDRAKNKRATAATNANERSSRSHSVFMVQVKAHNDNTGENIDSTLNLIDLAGSERVGETGSSGTRLKEAQKINGSLSNLANVISAIANKDSHIPFRNSKLTFMLKDSLGGNSKTLMIVNVNPTKRAVSETINTLRFATTVNKCNIGTAQKVIKF